eukprot:7389579-Prymnesium_polylepis.2
MISQLQIEGRVRSAGTRTVAVSAPAAVLPSCALQPSAFVHLQPPFGVCGRPVCPFAPAAICRLHSAAA